MRLRLVVLCLAACAMAAAEQAPPTCTTVDECRRLALEAAARSDFESFHDLAWLTVRTGRPNDPDLMYLLARAQSLSGRPHDALVMLRRLAVMGVATDAETNDDFRRVRALAGWADVAALTTGLANRKTSAPVAGTSVAPTVSPSSRSRSSPSDVRSRPEALTIARGSFAPVGLAYDAVSRRFIAGDRRANKLMVLDEEFGRVNDLAGAASAGFFGLTAVAIDRRRGDLWVANAKEDGSQTALHKLQLISGRVLHVFPLPSDHGPARFADIALTVSGAVLALDGLGRRIFPLREGVYAPALSLEADRVLSIAALDEHIAYVATPAGLVRVDFSARGAAPVRARRGVNLKDFAHIRVHRGSIVAVQRGDGVARIVRVRLDPTGAQAVSSQVVSDVPIADPSSMSIDGSTLHYLARDANGVTTVRHIALKASR